MKGKLIAAAATEMNDIHDPIITPRCIGGFLACSGFVLGSAAISRVEVLPLGSSECRPNSIEVLRSMAAERQCAGRHARGSSATHAPRIRKLLGIRV